MQQILDDLSQPHGIGIDNQRFTRHANGELAVCRARHRPERLQDFLDCGTEVDVLSMELDMAARDAGNVEQVVDQARHVADAALDRVACLDASRLLAANRVEDLDPVGERRQRIAQLVGEGRQKLILPPVGRRELGHHPLPVGDVAVDFQDPEHVAILGAMHHVSAFDQDAHAVAAGVRHLALPAVLAAQQRVDIGAASRRGLQQRVRDLAECFGLGPAVHVLRAVVPGGDDTVAVAGDDGVGRQVDQRSLLPQPGRLRGHLFDVEQDHDRAVDTVVGGPEGMDAQQVMPALAVANLALADLGGVDDLGDEGLQVLDIDRGSEVADRSPDVGREHIEQLRRSRREATDAQVRRQGDHRYIGGQWHYLPWQAKMQAPIWCRSGVDWWTNEQDLEIVISCYNQQRVSN